MMGDNKDMLCPRKRETKEKIRQKNLQFSQIRLKFSHTCDFNETPATVSSRTQPIGFVNLAFGARNGV